MAPNMSIGGGLQGAFIAISAGSQVGVAISTRHQFACRHFIALVSLFQGCAACRNLPLSGPYRRVGLGGGGGGE